MGVATFQFEKQFSKKTKKTNGEKIEQSLKEANIPEG